MKPTLSDTRWAVTGAGVDATNLTAPSSGEKDTGYVINQTPTSGKWNYWRRKAHAWFEFLDSYFDSSGNVTVAGDVIVGGHVRQSTLQTKRVPLSPSGTTYSNTSGILTSSGSLASAMMVPSQLGERIVNVRLRCKDSSSGPTKIRLQFGRYVPGSGFTQLGSVLSSGAGAIQTVTLSATNYTVIAGEMPVIVVDNFGGGTGACEAYYTEADIDWP